jgi:hypothetical protein
MIRRALHGLNQLHPSEEKTDGRGKTTNSEWITYTCGASAEHYNKTAITQKLLPRGLIPKEFSEATKHHKRPANEAANVGRAFILGEIPFAPTVRRCG